MAKVVATREVVFAAADAITAAGQEPSILAVQGQIGAGSYSTVKRWLDEWNAARRTQATTVELPPPLATQSTDLARSLWNAALALADQQTTQVRAALGAEIQGLQGRLRDAEQIIGRLEAEAEAASTQLHQTTQQIAAAQTALEEAQLAARVHAAQVTDLHQRLTEVQHERDQQRAELTQAQAALLAQARLEGEVGALRRQVADQQASIERLSTTRGKRGPEAPPAA